MSENTINEIKFKLAKMKESALQKYLENRKWNKQAISFGRATVFQDDTGKIIAGVIYDDREQNKYRLFIPD